MPRNEPQDEALHVCRTLVADIFPRSLKNNSYPATFRQWWTSMLAQRITVLTSQLGTNEDIVELLLELGTERDWLPSVSDVLDAADNLQDITKSPIQAVVHRLWTCRRFFCTTSGYFGLGSRCLDIGDEVWILKGGRTPFIPTQADE